MTQTSLPEIYQPSRSAKIDDEITKSIFVNVQLLFKSIKPAAYGVTRRHDLLRDSAQTLASQ